MLPILKNNDGLRQVWQDLRKRKLSRYADEILKRASKDSFWLDKFNNRSELERIVTSSQINEEVADFVSRGKTGEEIASLYEYSHYSFLRNVVRLSRGTSPGNLSVEYNEVSDILLRRLDGIIREQLGKPPVGYSLIQLGSKGRSSSDLFSDADITVVHEETSPENALYFECYASKLCRLMKRIEYFADMPVHPDSPEKERLMREAKESGAGMWQGRGDFELQHMFGFLAGSTMDFFEYLKSEEADIVQRTALLDITPIIDAPGISKRLKVAVRAGLLRGPGRIRFLDEIAEELRQDKTRYHPQDFPDVKKGYGGLLTITKTVAYMKALFGEYRTHPDAVFREAVNRKLMSADEKQALAGAADYLRMVRNSIHIRGMDISEYTKARPVDRIVDYEDTAFDLSKWHQRKISAKEVERSVWLCMENVRLTAEQVVLRS